MHHSFVYIHLSPSQRLKRQWYALRCFEVVLLGWAIMISYWSLLIIPLWWYRSSERYGKFVSLTSPLAVRELSYTPALGWCVIQNNLQQCHVSLPKAQVLSGQVWMQFNRKTVAVITRDQCSEEVFKKLKRALLIPIDVH